MKFKPVIARHLAHRDVDEAVLQYLREGSVSVVLSFIDALEHAYAHIGRHAATGSPRYGHELNLAGLRHWQLGRFPFLVFYVEREDHIDVWRVLHAERDIPDWMKSEA